MPDDDPFNFDDLLQGLDLPELDESIPLPSVDSLITSDEDDEEDSDYLTPTQIYDQLALEGELLLTIPLEEAPTLKAKISGAKAKRNERLKAQGLPTDERKFVFGDPVVSKDNPAICTVHIRLGVKQGIRILKIEKPDNSI